MHLHACLHTCEYTYTQAKNIQNAHTLTVQLDKLNARIFDAQPTDIEINSVKFEENQHLK